MRTSPLVPPIAVVSAGSFVRRESNNFLSPLISVAAPVMATAGIKLSSQTNFHAHKSSVPVLSNPKRRDEARGWLAAYCLRMAKDDERIKGFNKHLSRREDNDVKNRVTRIRNAHPALQEQLDCRSMPLIWWEDPLKSDGKRSAVDSRVAKPDSGHVGHITEKAEIKRNNTGKNGVYLDVEETLRVSLLPC